MAQSEPLHRYPCESRVQVGTGPTARLGHEGVQSTIGVDGGVSTHREVCSRGVDLLKDE